MRISAIATAAILSAGVDPTAAFTPLALLLSPEVALSAEVLLLLSLGFELVLPRFLDLALLVRLSLAEFGLVLALFHGRGGGLLGLLLLLPVYLQ